SESHRRRSLAPVWPSCGISAKPSDHQATHTMAHEGNLLMGLENPVRGESCPHVGDQIWNAQGAADLRRGIVVNIYVEIVERIVIRDQRRPVCSRRIQPRVSAIAPKTVDEDKRLREAPVPYITRHAKGCRDTEGGDEA